MKQTILASIIILLSTYCHAQSNGFSEKGANKIDTIYINSGEKLFLEAEADSNNNLILKQVDNVADMTKTIIIEPVGGVNF
jgi:hypothetical protein